MGITNDLRNNKDKIEYLLEKYPTTRDSDKLLWLAFNCEFHGLKEVLGSKYIPFRRFLMNRRVPTFETLSRGRRKIQETGKCIGENSDYRKQEAQNVSDWATGRLL